MPAIAILSDAHLLMQAEWLDDESRIAEEGEEVLGNFCRVLDQLKKDSPDAVIFAGDMFDYRTKGGQRVSHREGEKYMLRIRDAISTLVSGLKCNVYSLKGNHDSESVLRGLEKTVPGFLYAPNRHIDIDNVRVFLLNSNYVQGPYEIPLERLPSSADMVIMHESMPLWGMQGPSAETFRKAAKRFKLVLNGHMHTFHPKVFGIPNLFLIPALIPSREIKNNWVLRYKYPENEKPETRETPFGYVWLEEGEVKFVPYKPVQTVVRAEISGDRAEDFLSGVRTIYDLLTQRSDREKLRVWVETNADPIVIDRIIKPEVASYREIRTLDVIRTKGPRPLEVEAVPAIEFGSKAFTLDELTDRVLSELRGTHREIARELFDEVLTRDVLLSRADESRLFKQLLESMASRYKASEAFVTRAWELAKEK